MSPLGHEKSLRDIPRRGDYLFRQPRFGSIFNVSNTSESQQLMSKSQQSTERVT